MVVHGEWTVVHDVMDEKKRKKMRALGTGRLRCTVSTLSYSNEYCSTTSSSSCTCSSPKMTTPSSALDKNNLTLQWQETEQELAWANQVYASLRFVPSTSADRLLLARVDNQLVGMGRIVQLDEQNVEIGGIYVKESHRNKGVARRMVQRLAQETRQEPAACWILGFRHLMSFYQSMGFDIVAKSQSWPCCVCKKVGVCGNTFSEGCVTVLRQKLVEKS